MCNPNFRVLQFFFIFWRRRVVQRTTRIKFLRCMCMIRQYNIPGIQLTRQYIFNAGRIQSLGRTRPPHKSTSEYFHDSLSHRSVNSYQPLSSLSPSRYPQSVSQNRPIRISPYLQIFTRHGRNSCSYNPSCARIAKNSFLFVVFLIIHHGRSTNDQSAVF